MGEEKSRNDAESQSVEYEIYLIWDSKAGVWIATSDVLGIVLTHAELPGIVSDAKRAAGEMIELNQCPPGDYTLKFKGRDIEKSSRMEEVMTPTGYEAHFRILLKEFSIPYVRRGRGSYDVYLNPSTEPKEQTVPCYTIDGRTVYTTLVQNKHVTVGWNILSPHAVDMILAQLEIVTF